MALLGGAREDTRILEPRSLRKRVEHAAGVVLPPRHRLGDYIRHKLWTMRFSSTGKLVRPPEDPPFGTDIGAPVKFAAGPNGDIVYADISSGNLRRLTY